MDEKITWRPSRWMSLTYQVMGLAIVIGTAWTWSGPTAPGDAWARPGLIALGLCLFWLPWRCKIVLDGEKLVVQNVLFKHRALLRDVENVEASYGGLNIHLTGGRMVQATLVGEKSNVSNWLGRKTRGDVQGEKLLRLAQKRRRAGNV